MKYSIVAVLALGSLVYAAPSPPTKLAVRSTLCGVKGYDKSSPGAYSYTTKSADLSQSGCAAKCAKDSKCASYAVGSGACLLYTSSVASNVQPASNSPYTFYDKSCSSTASPNSSAPNPSLPSTPGSGSPGTNPSGAICGSAGYDKSRPESYYSSTKEKYRTVYGCQSLCTSKKGCVSFALGHNECLLYKAPVTGNFQAVASSPYRFYDVVCGTSTPSSVSSFSPARPSSSVESQPVSSAAPSLSVPSSTTSEPASSTPASAAPSSSTLIVESSSAFVTSSVMSFAASSDIPSSSASSSADSASSSSLMSSAISSDVASISASESLTSSAPTTLSSSTPESSGSSSTASVAVPSTFVISTSSSSMTPISSSVSEAGLSSSSAADSTTSSAAESSTSSSVESTTSSAADSTTSSVAESSTSSDITAPSSTLSSVSSSASASSTPVVPPPQGCSITGAYDPAKVISSNTLTADGSQTACRALCVSAPGCVSYAYTPGMGCTLASGYVNDPASFTPSSASNLWAFDLTCDLLTCGVMGGVPHFIEESSIYDRDLSSQRTCQQYCAVRGADCQGIAFFENGCVPLLHGVAASYTPVGTMDPNIQSASYGNSRVWSYFEPTCPYDKTSPRPAAAATQCATLGPDGDGGYITDYTLAGLTGATLDDCKALCLGDLRCAAYVFQNDECYTFIGDVSQITNYDGSTNYSGPGWLMYDSDC